MCHLRGFYVSLQFLAATKGSRIYSMAKEPACVFEKVTQLAKIEAEILKKTELNLKC